jgi:hypothetical protein
MIYRTESNEKCRLGRAPALPRAQHQRETGRAGGDGQLIGAFHFSRGKYFHAESSI